MAIYSEKVDEVLKVFEGLSNPLFKYDNYTYHIQFFLVDKQTQKDYSRERFHNFFTTASSALDITNECAKNANALLDGHKFIIAESGKTNDISIVSLDIKSIPGFGTNNKTYAASSEFKLKIKETAGNGLVNKMHLVASMLGYRSYINTPYFLTLWFTGYNNTNLEIPEEKIQDAFAKDLSYLTYQVIIEDVKTSVGEDSTTYDMTLRPITDMGLIQTFSSVHTFKARDIKPGEPIGSIFKMVETAKNNELRENMKDGLYEAIYGETENAFEIRTTDLLPNFGDIKELFEIADVETEVEQNIRNAETSADMSINAANKTITDMENEHGNVALAHTQEMSRIWNDDEGKYKGFWGTFGQVASLLSVGTSFLVTSTANFAERTGAKMALSSIIEETTQNKQKTIDEQMNKKYYDIGLWPMANCPFEPDTVDNITSILTEIFQICCPGSDYMPTYNFVPEYITDYQGVAYYKVILYVSYVQIPGMNYIMRNKNEQALLDYALYGPKTIEEAQIDYLRTTIFDGALLKKYRWLLNGVENSVLNYDTTEDLFWYLNTGDYASKLAKENTSSINRNNIIYERSIADNNAKILMDILNAKLGANAEGKHTDININDISNMVDSQTAELMDSTFIRGAEMNDIYIQYQMNISSDKNEKENNKDDEERLKINANIQDSKIGAQNMLSHGQKCELKLKILGDPYWLSFMSENVQIAERSLPHLIMDIKTYSKLDGYDNPVEDEMMRMITVYRITDIESHFQEGKFIQDLHGYIATPFAHGYNPTFYKKIGTIENMNMDNLVSGNILIDNFGNIKILKGTTSEFSEENALDKKDYINRKNSKMSSSNSSLVVTLDDGTKFTADKYEDIQNSELIKDAKY